MWMACAELPGAAWMEIGVSFALSPLVFVRIRRRQLFISKSSP
jgi:hypothetical protein